MPSEPPTLRKGQLVAVNFMDHCAGNRALTFVVWGRLASVGRKALVVEVWGYPNKSDKPDANCERYTILRSAVLSVVRLRLDK